MNFNLANKVGGARADEQNARAAEPQEKEKVDDSYLPTHYTDAEQDKLLTGYDLVPEAGWPLLRPKTHVRYETKRGEFRRGGFVHNVKVKGKPMIFLETGFDPKAAGYRKWPVTLEDVEKFWKKRTLEDVQIAEAQVGTSPELQLRVEVLEQSVRGQEVQIAKLQEENKKLLRILSKLNDKIVRIARGGEAASPGTSPAPRVVTEVRRPAAAAPRTPAGY